MNNISTVLFLSIFFNLSFLVGQEVEPITNFAPLTYGGENQNWSISQTENGFLFWKQQRACRVQWKPMENLHKPKQNDYKIS